VVDDERRLVALVSMQAIVTSLIALFLQEGFHLPAAPGAMHRAYPGGYVSPKRDRPKERLLVCWLEATRIRAKSKLFRIPSQTTPDL